MNQADILSRLKGAFSRIQSLMTFASLRSTVILLLISSGFFFAIFWAYIAPVAGVSLDPKAGFTFDDLSYAKERNVHLRLSQIRSDIFDITKVDDRLILATGEGILVSTDEGMSWTQLFDTADYVVKSLGVAPDGKIWAIASDSSEFFLYSTDNGLTFRRHQHTPEPESNYDRFRFFDGGRIQVFDLKNNRIIFSENNGDSWATARIGDGNFKAIASDGENRLFAITNNNKSGLSQIEVFNHNFSGTTTRQSLVTQSVFQNDIIFIKNLGVFAIGENGQLLKYANNAWTPTSLQLPPLSTTILPFGDNINSSRQSNAVSFAGSVKVNTRLMQTDLHSITFIDTKTGWAGGEHGVIYKTIDGGENWVWLTAEAPTTIEKLTFIDEHEGYAIGAFKSQYGKVISGDLWQTKDGGESWQLLNSASYKDAYHSEKQQIQLIQGNALLSSGIKGDNWSYKPLNNALPFTAIETIQSGKLLGIVNGEHFALSPDNGLTWQNHTIYRDVSHSSSIKLSTSSMRPVLDRTLYWLAMSQGNEVLLYYKDRETLLDNSLIKPVFKRDNQVLKNPPSSIEHMVFTSPRNGWAIANSMLFYTEDGGETWHDPDPNRGFPVEPASDMFLGNDGNIWVIGKYGKIAMQAPNKDIPLVITDTTFEGLNTGFFINEQKGWIVGKNNLIISTNDGGSTWTRHTPAKSIAGDELTNIFFADEHYGWISDGYGIAFYTHDGGATWHQPVYSTTTPMISYVLLVLATLLLVFWVYILRIKASSSDNTPQNLDEIAISDRAITSLKEDKLRFGPLALGLSRFIQNKNTAAPITMAITGNWGAGKSSLMGLIQDDLQQARFHPVWFNAWHHHDEAHLLGALLETIRNEGLPPLWRVSGLIFRLRLIAKRMWRASFMMVLMASLFIGLMYLTNNTEWTNPKPATNPEKVTQTKEKANKDSELIELWQITQASKDTEAANSEKPSDKQLIEVWRKQPDKKSETDKSKTELPNLLSQWTDKFITPNTVEKSGIGAFLLMLLIWLNKAFRAFGGDSKKLFSYIHGNASTLSLDPGIRYKVNQALEDISWALRDKKLVLIIDDLDRCPPGQILKVLECVNFLSSGRRKSYIILGMAIDKVLPIISKEFNEVVDESLEEIESETPEQREKRLKQGRLAYAGDYLKKMINIEICTPTTTSERISALTTNQVTLQDPLESDKRKLTLYWLDRLALPAAILSLAFYTLPLLYQSFEQARKTSPTVVVDNAKTKQTSVAAKPNNVEATTNAQQTSNQRLTNGKTADEYYLAPVESHTQITDLWLLALFSLVIFVAYLLKSTEVKDSPDFLEAIKIWAKIMTYFDKTPRNFKRSVNLLRLLSMRVPSIPSRLTKQSDMAAKFILLKALRGVKIDDKQTKALFDRLGDPKTLDYLVVIDELKALNLDEKYDPDFVEILASAIITHAKKFSNGDSHSCWPQQEDINTYQSLMAGIELS